MYFNGKVVEFNNESRSYLINFDLSSEMVNIKEGSADVVLKYGDTTLNIHNFDLDSLDKRTINLMKIKFLDTIYMYNKSKTGTLRAFTYNV